MPPKPKPPRQTPKQREHTTYMMDVMRRLEWDLHNAVELTGRIPEEWHEIAQATPHAPKVKVNLCLEADVLRFFRSMGEGYGPRINEVLKSYMHARLAGLIRGADTRNHYRRRAEEFSGPKPKFGEIAAFFGEAWEEDGPPVVDAVKARYVEILQSRYGEEGVPDGAVEELRIR